MIVHAAAQLGGSRRLAGPWLPVTAMPRNTGDVGTVTVNVPVSEIFVGARTTAPSVTSGRRSYCTPTKALGANASVAGARAACRTTQSTGVQVVAPGHPDRRDLQIEDRDEVLDRCTDAKLRRHDDAPPTSTSTYCVPATPVDA